MDPFLLSAWALEGGAPAQVLDLGTGSGIMALLLARLGLPVQGYDLRLEWIRLARRSAAESGLDVAFHFADIRELAPADADLALLNPPYLELGRGEPSPDPWKAAARFELNGDLVQLVAAAARLTRRLCLVIRADRADQALRAVELAGLHPSRSCLLDDALFLLEGRRELCSHVREQACMRRRGAWSPRVRGWYESLGARLT